MQRCEAAYAENFWKRKLDKLQGQFEERRLYLVIVTKV